MMLSDGTIDKPVFKAEKVTADNALETTRLVPT